MNGANKAAATNKKAKTPAMIVTGETSLGLVERRGGEIASMVISCPRSCVVDAKSWIDGVIKNVDNQIDDDEQ